MRADATIGDDDQFESSYMARLRALLTGHGVPLSYEKDRAGIDTGLHLFVEGPSGHEASQVRVWFQVKGKRASTLSLADYQKGESVDVRVPTDYLRFWYAAPEPVYLVVYLEAADEFVAEDVRDVVDRHWPSGSFYEGVPKSQRSVTLRLDTTRVLDAQRLTEMLAHRSMRIDGPAFRGRPLGHRFDPLRSQIEVLQPELFERVTRALLDAHDFRERTSIEISPHLSIRTGRLYQTLEWQSPAFAEYGFGPGDDFRDEPPIEAMHGEVAIICDTEPERPELLDGEKAAVASATQGLPMESTVAVVFNGRDLSSSGGLWRSTLRTLKSSTDPIAVRQLGLEAVTSLLRVATLVYLDFAPELAWRYVNFQY